MSFNKFEDSQETFKVAVKSDVLDSTRHTIYDAEGSNFFKNLDKQLKGPHGVLPPIDLVGFDKEAPDHSSGLEKLWHGVEHLFGKHRETVGDQVREKVVDEMKNSKNPSEQANYKKYQEEEKSLQKYEEEVRRWGLQMSLVSEYPKPPATPMHDEVAARARKQEEKIIESVRAHMTPAERKQVDADAKKYQEGVKEAHTIRDPYGTGELFKPEPSPSEALARYWRHIQEASDLYTGR